MEACQAHHCVLVTASPGAPLKPSVHIFRACLHFSCSARSSCGPQLASVAPLSWALPPSRNPFVFPRSSLFAHVVTTNPTPSPPPNTTPHTTSQLRATACALHQFIVHRQHANGQQKQTGLHMEECPLHGGCKQARGSDDQAWCVPLGLHSIVGCKSRLCPVNKDPSPGPGQGSREGYCTHRSQARGPPKNEHEAGHHHAPPCFKLMISLSG